MLRKTQFLACLLLLSLSWIASTLLDSLAYIENITDAINDIEQTEIEQTETNVFKVQTITSTSSQLLHPWCSLIISAESIA